MAPSVAFFKHAGFTIRQDGIGRSRGGESRCGDRGWFEGQSKQSVTARATGGREDTGTLWTVPIIRQRLAAAKSAGLGDGRKDRRAVALEEDHASTV